MSGKFQTENTFFLKNVDIKHPQCLLSDYKELEIACHRLYRGEKIAIAFREYFADEPERQKFRKITMLLPNNTKAGDKFYIPQDDVVIFYSHGLSFSPGKSGCFGTIEKGELDIISKDDQTISIHLSGDITLKRPLNRGTACGLSKLDKSITAVYKKYEDLSPWDGKINKGASLTEETYPH